MDIPSISQDDLMDVMEMTQKLEDFISSVLKDNEHSLALSALMSSSTNLILAQCKSLDEAMFYRNLFVQIFDISIKHIKVKGSDNEPSNPDLDPDPT